MSSSTVGIVFLVLFCVFVAYLVLGSIVRCRRGLNHFPEMLPHYVLWCQVAYYIVLLFTCGKIRLFYPSSSYMGFGSSGGVGLGHLRQSDLVVLPSRPDSGLGAGGMGGAAPVDRFAAVMKEEELDEFDMEAALNPAEIVVVY